jgi:hypothetical protein
MVEGSSQYQHYPPPKYVNYRLNYTALLYIISLVLFVGPRYVHSDELGNDMQKHGPIPLLTLSHTGGALAASRRLKDPYLKVFETGDVELQSKSGTLKFRIKKGELAELKALFQRAPSFSDLSSEILKAEIDAIQIHEGQRSRPLDASTTVIRFRRHRLSVYNSNRLRRLEKLESSPLKRFLQYEDKLKELVNYQRRR